MAREFWITEENISDIHHASGVPPQNDTWTEKRFKIHVREIVPLNWEKIWQEVWNRGLIVDIDVKAIQDIIETHLTK